MKKVMFVFVMLLVASTCFAQLQSGPSNTVGYVKIVATGGTGTVSTPFGLPFKFWDVPAGGIPSYGVVSTNPSDIAGDQTNCGTTITADRILRQGNGESAFRNSAAGCAWQGTLETNADMVPGRAYWYQNKTGANRNFVLAGEVDIVNTYATVAIAAGAFNPYSWRDSRSRDRSNLQLLASGFTGGTSSLNSDRVVTQQTSGAFFWRRTTDNTWQGTLVTVDPGVAYWIQNRHAAYNYNYNPSSNAGLSVPMSPAGDVSKGITTAKMPAAPVSKSKAVERAR